MKKYLSLVITFLIVIISGKSIYAHGVTYSVKQIGENTITITLNTDLQADKGIEITSASKRGGKILNIFYRIEDGAKSSNTMDVDLRTMLPPIRIVLTDISSPDKTLFPDTKGIYQEEYIQHLHDMGAIDGFPDGTFKPAKSVSRAEFVTMLLNTLKTDKKSTTKGFKDVSKHWAKDAINTAYEMKIIDGFGDGTFRPNDKITVAQGIKMIDNLVRFRTSTYTDLPKLNTKHWAYESIKRMMSAGIIIKSDPLFESFNEKAYLSRADCAMMLSRAITTQ